MPETQEMLERATEKLKKIAVEQMQEVEPQIVEKIIKGEAFADLAQKSAKMSQNVARLTDEKNELEKQLKAEQAESKALNTRLDDFEKKFGEIDRGPRQAKTIGGEFTKNAIPDEATAKKAFDQASIRSTNPFLHRVIKDGAEAFMQKNISTAAGSGEALADSLRLPGVITQPEDALVVQALLPRTFTDSESIDYVRELAYTDLTATVAESTGTGSLVTKPQGNITFELVSENMTTIAQWIPASRQILRFSRRTQLQSYIDRRLRDRVLLELEDQVLLGDGLTTNMTGLVTGATAYTGGYANIQGAAPTEIDTLRRAITQLQLTNYMATGHILNPADWESIELNKDTQLRYILAASPQNENQRRLWGVPVVPSNRMTAGEFLTGDIARSAELFIGMDLTVMISTEHASFFIQNMVAILAEMFALLAIYTPEGLITGGLTQGSGS